MTIAARPLRDSELYTSDRRQGLGRRVARFGAYLLACVTVARQRRRLLMLDDRMLKDIGISRADAHREAGRGFRDIPKDRMLDD